MTEKAEVEQPEMFRTCNLIETNINFDTDAIEKYVNQAFVEEHKIEKEELSKEKRIVVANRNEEKITSFIESNLGFDNLLSMKFQTKLSVLKILPININLDTKFMQDKNMTVDFKNEMLEMNNIKLEINNAENTMN